MTQGIAFEGSRLHNTKGRKRIWDEEDLKQDREAGKSQFKMNIVKRSKKKSRVKNF